MKSIDPKQRYYTLKKQHQLSDDIHQEQLIKKINHFFYHITNKKNTLIQLAQQFLSTAINRKKPQGLYIWGPSGIGKTLIMDCFYSCLDPNIRLRQHSVKFIQYIHQQLTKLQGHRNPLSLVAKEIIHKTDVLCLDEFQIINVADLMLWRNLLQHLLQSDLYIVITSNSPPEECYKGVDEQQQKLAPLTLDLKNNLDVIHMLNQIDYRKEHPKDNKNANKYGGFIFHNDIKKSTAMLEDIFTEHSHGHSISNKPITVHNRPIKIIKQAGDTIWLSFTDMCSIPRCYRDYIWLSEKYRVVIISELTHLKRSDRAKLINFIALIDILTDNCNHIFISSTTQIDAIYTDTPQPFALSRLLSRLHALV